MNRIKAFMNDFPTLGGSAVTALALLFLTGVNVNVLLARQKPMPDGYDGWFWLLGALGTGSFAAMIGKRLTDRDYAAAKNPPPVTAEAGATVTVTATHPVAAATVSPDPKNLVRVEQPSAATARDITRRQTEAVEKMPTAPAGADF